MDKKIILEVKNLKKKFGPPAGGFVILRLKAEEYNSNHILHYVQDDSLLVNTE